MQESFAALAAELQRDLGADIGLRVGINTGEVVVSPDTDDIVGDPVNVAARLEAAAAVGEVLLGVETGRLGARRDPGRGRSRPRDEGQGAACRGDAHRRERSADVGGRDGVRRSRGRSRSARLACSTRPLRVGQARLVTVVGSPGLGKSRLAAEVATRLADSGDDSRGAVHAVGRAARSGRSSTRSDRPRPRRDRSTDDDVRGCDRGAVFASGRRLRPGRRDRRRARHRIRRRGRPSSSSGRCAGCSRRLPKSARSCCSSMTCTGPSRHCSTWSSTSRSGRGGPMLVLALARPELRDRRPTWSRRAGRRPRSSCWARSTTPPVDAWHSICSRPTSFPPACSGGRSKRARAIRCSSASCSACSSTTACSGGSTDGGEQRSTREASSCPRRSTRRWRPASSSCDLRSARCSRRLRSSAVTFPAVRSSALLPEDVAADLDTHLDALRRRELVDAESTWWANDRLYRFHHALDPRRRVSPRPQGGARRSPRALLDVARDRCGSGLPSRTRRSAGTSSKRTGSGSSSASSTTRRPAASPNAPARTSRTRRSGRSTATTSRVRRSLLEPSASVGARRRSSPAGLCADTATR